MRAHDQFLMRLYERTGGRTDRTLHAYLHIARPLALSLAETRACLAALVGAELIEADPEFDRLIRLTPVGAATCARRDAGETVAPLSPRPVAYAPAFVLSPEMGSALTAQ